ncbi:unnamed protein product [Brachionus calyciflorus]|uniref:Uncharacterized protein n=1 Tax=Brachionus calyciflorus TaxID=104777 RepID=A0A814RJX3_9BILA|nr:unnamed protein product [Brachionus calyciflorus]
MNHNNSFESSDHYTQESNSSQNTGYSSFEQGAFNAHQGTQVDDTQSSQNFSSQDHQQQFITINWDQASSNSVSNNTQDNTFAFNNNDISSDERLNTQDFFLTSQDFFSNSQISSSQESDSENKDSWN